MKNTCWVCALVLCSGSWTSSLRAQQAPSPTPAPAQPATAATLPAASATPAPSPTVAPGAAAKGTLPAFTACAPDAPSVLFGQDGVHQARFYVSGEYLLWWIKDDHVPVLSSTSTNPFDNGELGRPTTEVLYGGGSLGDSSFSGFRITAGWWLDDCKDTGFEVRGFYLAPRGNDFNANSNQFPTLARPFFNVNQGVEFAEITAFPGRFTGSQAINNESQLFGAEANNFCRLCCGCDYRLDLFGGFRFIDLEDSLSETEFFHGLATAPAPYTNSDAVGRDYFSTSNQFYGGQVGLRGEYDIGPFTVEARGSVALGDTHQNILIDGSQVVTAPNGTVQVFKGDLLALTSNIGRYNSDRFGVIPELDFNVGYLVTSHIRAFVGYDVLYWNNVVRAGEQIDRNLDITLIPNFAEPGVKSAGQTQPAALRPSTDFWAQGLTFGLEFRY